MSLRVKIAAFNFPKDSLYLWNYSGLGDVLSNSDKCLYSRLAGASVLWGHPQAFDHWVADGSAWPGAHP